MILYSQIQKICLPKRSFTENPTSRNRHSVDNYMARSTQRKKKLFFIFPILLVAVVISPQLLETFLSFFPPASFPQGCQSEVRFYGNGSNRNSLQMARERRWMPSLCWERGGTCGDEAKVGVFPVKDTVTSLASDDQWRFRSLTHGHLNIFLTNMFRLS